MASHPPELADYIRRRFQQVVGADRTIDVPHFMILSTSELAVRREIEELLQQRASSSGPTRISFASAPHTSINDKVIETLSKVRRLHPQYTFLLEFYHPDALDPRHRFPWTTVEITPTPSEHQSPR